MSPKEICLVVIAVAAIAGVFIYFWKKAKKPEPEDKGPATGKSKIRPRGTLDI